MKTYSHLSSCFLSIAVAVASFATAAGADVRQETHLTDLLPLSATQGFGTLQMDHSVEGRTLTIVGREYANGLGTHAQSEIVYHLGGEYDRFEAQAGVDDEMTSSGRSSVVFKVLGDGRVLFQSGIMRVGTRPCHIDVSIAGCEELTLLVTDAGDGIDSDHADWIQPTLYGTGPVAVVPAPSKTAYKVKSPVATLSLSADGEITGFKFRHSGELPVRGGTRLPGCKPCGSASAVRLAGGGVEFTRTLMNRLGQRCCVTDQFTPDSDSIRWTVEVRGEGAPWSTPIISQLSFPHAEQQRFWAAWQDPQPATNSRAPRTWHDPLEAVPFTTRTGSYGEPSTGDFCSGDIISLPLVSVFFPERKLGLSLIESPDDTILDLRLATTSDRQVTLRRSNYRISGDRAVRINLALVPHPDDSRAVLAWMAQEYPRFFEPPNPQVQQMAGMAAYTGEEKSVDVDRLRRMSFRVLWKLSDDYAYMGMFLPPLTNSDQRWERTSDAGDPPGYKPQWTNFRRLNDFAHYLNTNGFYLLSYFNATEFGKDMKRVQVTPSQARDPDLWKNPSAYLQVRMPDAPIQPLSGAWQGGWAVDPGDPKYMDYLVEQAERHVSAIADAAGICIDRADYLRNYNLGGDDGVSWPGQKARALVVSWRHLMDRLGPEMHSRGKVIFCNLLDPRLDLVRQIDGIYHEFGYEPTAANGAALLCVYKPLLVWTRNEDKLSDAFFQRYLYLGAFPTAPYPLNNHCIQPSAERDEWYFDYAPLFDSLRGKRWVLRPHCVDVADNLAKANLFRVTGGWAVPVILGGTNTTVVLRIRNVPELTAISNCSILHPGKGSVPINSIHRTHEGMEINVPLVRGCAVVKLMKKAS